MMIAGILTQAVMRVLPGVAAAAVATGPSRFWQALSAGQHQTLVIWGSSMSGPTWSAWPRYLEETLEAKFGTVTVHHRAHPDLRATVMQEPIRLDSIMACQPNAVIVECACDDESYCDSGRMCVYAAWKNIVDGIRQRDSRTEIFWYIVGPWCNARGMSALEWNAYLAPAFEQQRELCAAESLYLVDTWYPILDSLQTIPGYTSSGDCGRLALWFPDSHHPSGFVSSQIIVPLFLSVMSGQPIDASPPQGTVSALSARLLSAGQLQISFSGLNAGSDPETGLLAYNIWGELVPPCTTYYTGHYTIRKTIPSAMTQWVDTGYQCARTYWVTAVNGFGREGEPSAPLTPVVDDSLPPTLLRIVANGPGDTLLLVFSEPLDSLSAVEPAHYGVVGGASVVTAAVLTGAGNVVALCVTPLTACRYYSVSVTGIHDRSVLANALAPCSTAFFYSGQPLPLCFSSPRPGVAYEIGDTLRLVWDCDTVQCSNLVFSVSCDGGETYQDMFGQSIPARAGSAAWVVPDSVGGTATAGSDAFILVHEYGIPALTAHTERFRIVAPGRDTVSTPDIPSEGCGCGSGTAQALLVPLVLQVPRFLGRRSGRRRRSRTPC